MSNNKKVLYITYDGLTDPLGQSQVLPYLVELSRQGYSISILSFEKKARYTAERKIIEMITEGASIRWIPLFFTSRPPIISKMYDRWRMLRKARQLHRQEKFDLIHCRSYISAEAGLQLKKSTGVSFLFDMRGFWADEKVDCGQWNLKKTFYRKLYQSYKKKEKQFLLNADGIISLTAAGRDYLLSKSEYRQLSIDVIPCCADLEHFDFNKIPASLTLKIKDELGIGADKKVITYLGSIGGWYMTKEMFSFYKKLIEKRPEFVFLILTKDEPERVRKEVEDASLPLENFYIRYSPRSEVPAYLSISDASLFFIYPSFSKTASSPTKHGELMGMGIPVICNEIGDTGIIIRETGTGVVVKEFTDIAYEEAVTGINQVLHISKAEIRKSAFDYFDLKKGAGQYAMLYKKLIK